MRWSFKIARVAGIDIRVHITFFIIVIWGAAQFAKFGIDGILFGTALVLALFFCVVVHELGHSVVAQRFGVTVKQIVLLPIGGVAIMQRIPRNPWQELWIALAGPAVNVVIALAMTIGVLGKSLYNGVNWTDLLAPARGGEPSGALMVNWLLSANVALVLFNMIPAFPLDGGRVLRAILAMRMHYQRATAVAAAIGQFIAIALGLFGLVAGNILLVLVAAFIFLGAGAEQVEARAHAVLSGLRVGDAYNRHAFTLEPADHLNKVVRHLLTSYQPDFAVMTGPDLAGVVTRADVVGALAKHSGDVAVSTIMHPNTLHVDAHQTLEQVRSAMREAGAPLAAVYDGPHFLGLVSNDDIDEAFAILQFSDGKSDDAAAADDGGIVI